MDALLTRYALALSFFDRWQRRGVETAAEIARALQEYGDRTQEKLDWLREQLEMRTIGLGWFEFNMKWSSSKDDNVGSLSDLRDHLKNILIVEAKRRADGELTSKIAPSHEECPAPLLQRKTFKALGTPTVQADALCEARVCSDPEAILNAARRRRVELEEAGEIDWVQDRQPYTAGQGPPLDKNLIGKMLEVRWRYRHKDTGEPIYIWAEGEVVQVYTTY